MKGIAQELHCTTVMLIGDGKRLIEAARTALDIGLGDTSGPTSPSCLSRNCWSTWTPSPRRPKNFAGITLTA